MSATRPSLDMSGILDSLQAFHRQRPGPGKPTAKTAFRRNQRCRSPYCHGQCGRKPTSGTTKTPAVARRRARNKVARASRRANR